MQEATDRPGPRAAVALTEMNGLVLDLQRIGRALSGIASLACSGRPSQADLGALRSEDLAALLGTLADCTTEKAARLEAVLLPLLASACGADIKA